MGSGIARPIEIPEETKKGVLNYNVSLNEIVKYINDGKVKNICLKVGAGISVAAGIPDFRTKGTGLYDNLQKYNLSKPEMIFDISLFQENPFPFFDLSKDLFPSNFHPTVTHFFIKLLENKKLLRRVYSQNIDTLERRAGISPELIVEAHGSFGSATCYSCKKAYSQEYYKSQIFNESNPKPQVLCEDKSCGGYVKPDITFFGESLPKRFHDLREKDMKECDLLIVLGTSLKVGPFNTTMDYCNQLAPRILVNMERVGVQDSDSNGHGFKMDLFDNYRDAEYIGECDEFIIKFCELLGWKNELDAVIDNYVFESTALHLPRSETKETKNTTKEVTKKMEEMKVSSSPLKKSLSLTKTKKVETSPKPTITKVEATTIPAAFSKYIMGRVSLTEIQKKKFAYNFRVNFPETISASLNIPSIIKEEDDPIFKFDPSYSLPFCHWRRVKAVEENKEVKDEDDDENKEEGDKRFPGSLFLTVFLDKLPSECKVEDIELRLSSYFEDFTGDRSVDSLANEIFLGSDVIKHIKTIKTFSIMKDRKSQEITMLTFEIILKPQYLYSNSKTIVKKELDYDRVEIWISSTKLPSMFHRFRPKFV